MAKRKIEHGGKRKGSGRKPAHPEGKTSKIVASVPDVLIDKLETMAANRGWSRSEAVTEAIRRLVKRA